MAQGLPSLDLIKGFEAAARHLSFTRAAAELFVTQSAVSRQVKALEDHLGVALFERRHRALSLTEAGQELYRVASGVLQQLADTATRIRERGGGRVLTVTTTVGFASLWLIPRLADFRDRHPDIDIRIAANTRLLDLERERIELAIRYCPPRLAPPGSQHLFGEAVLPVCSPALLARTPLAAAEDLRRHVLLHYERPDGAAPWLTWTVWLEAMQVEKFKPAGALHFSQYDQVIQAAVDGQGVALGTSPLVRRLLGEGRLVAPLARKAQSSRAYFLVAAASAAARPEVQAFAAWLRGQAAAES